MNNPFDDVMKDLADLNPHDERLEVLDQFCQGLQANTHNGVECRLERGYATNLGQEWRVMAKPSSAGGPDYVLLRAHLEPGRRCHLDLYDEELSIIDGSEALAEALKRFARTDDFRTMLWTLVARPPQRP
jgi:hypothetical protein